MALGHSAQFYIQAEHAAAQKLRPPIGFVACGRQRCQVIDVERERAPHLFGGTQRVVSRDVIFCAQIALESVQGAIEFWGVGNQNRYRAASSFLPQQELGVSHFSFRVVEVKGKGNRI